MTEAEKMTPAEYEEILYKSIAKPCLKNLKPLEELVVTIAAKHKKGPRRVLQDCAKLFPKVR